MSSPIEERLLLGACPQAQRPFCVGLNIGCGNRVIGASIGVDYRPDAKAAVLIADARQLPVRSESLDYIISCHCLEHLRDGPLSVLREWVRCLKPGAPIAICVPDGSGGDVALSYQMPRGKHIEGQHVHLFTPETLVSYMRVAGIESVEVTTHDRIPYWNTRVLLGTGVRSAAFQESPYRWRAWTWAREVLRDLPFIPRMKAEYRDWKIGGIRRAVFGR